MGGKRKKRVVMGEEDEEEAAEEVQAAQPHALPSMPTYTTQTDSAASFESPLAHRKSRIVTGEGEEEEGENEGRDEFVDAVPYYPPAPVSEKEPSEAVVADAAVAETAADAVVALIETSSISEDSRTGAHKRLYDRNVGVRSALVACTTQHYQGALRQLTACSALLARSQGIVQDSDYHLRLLGDDLAALTSRLDIITSYELIPEIVMPNRSPSN